MHDWNALKTVCEAKLVALAWVDSAIYRDLLMDRWQDVVARYPSWFSGAKKPTVIIDQLLSYTLLLRPAPSYHSGVSIDDFAKELVDLFPSGYGMPYLDRKGIEWKISQTCTKNNEFKRRLMETPKSVLERLAGDPFPDDLQVKVIEEQADEWYCVIPPNPLDFAAPSKEELEAASGWHRRLGPYVFLEGTYGRVLASPVAEEAKDKAAPVTPSR